MRIGLFGGTFDPVHLGHLVLAERCREAADLDQVWFLPAYAPPHKQDHPPSRFDQRCDMLSLAVVGQPAFRIEPIERELPPPSYTANTLAELTHRHPDHEFHLLVGADTFLDLPNWHEPQTVAELAAFVMVGRPGFPAVDEAAIQRVAGAIGGGVRVRAVESPLIELASRDVQRQVREGRSIRFVVPRSVEEYVREKGLYQRAM